MLQKNVTSGLQVKNQIISMSSSASREVKFKKIQEKIDERIRRDLSSSTSNGQSQDRN